MITKEPQVKKPRWRKINSPRNSECFSSTLTSLDWTNWWADDTGFDTYLHVSRPKDGTFHRVYCRNVEECRIGMRDGVLYWIIDSPPGTIPSARPEGHDL